MTIQDPTLPYPSRLESATDPIPTRDIGESNPALVWRKFYYSCNAGTENGLV